jgi:hypothetical protein
MAGDHIKIAAVAVLNPSFQEMAVAITSIVQSSSTMAGDHIKIAAVAVLNPPPFRRWPWPSALLYKPPLQWQVIKT